MGGPAPPSRSRGPKRTEAARTLAASFNSGVAAYSSVVSLVSPQTGVLFSARVISSSGSTE